MRMSSVFVWTFIPKWLFINDIMLYIDVHVEMSYAMGIWRLAPRGKTGVASRIDAGHYLYEKAGT